MVNNSASKGFTSRLSAASNTKILRFVDQCEKLLSDPTRLEGLKGQGKSEGRRENSAKFSDRKYLKYTWDDYKHREVKMGWTT